MQGEHEQERRRGREQGEHGQSAGSQHDRDREDAQQRQRDESGASAQGGDGVAQQGDDPRTGGDEETQPGIRVGGDRLLGNRHLASPDEFLRSLESPYERHDAEQRRVCGELQLQAHDARGRRPEHRPQRSPDAHAIPHERSRGDHRGHRHERREQPPALVEHDRERGECRTDREEDRG